MGAIIGQGSSPHSQAIHTVTSTRRCKREGGGGLYGGLVGAGIMVIILTAIRCSMFFYLLTEVTRRFTRSMNSTECFTTNLTLLICRISERHETKLFV